MSTPINALSVAGSIGGVAQSVGNLANLLGGSSGWDYRLARASYGDIPFAVDSGHSVAGRRYAIHEYPFRDVGWVEDLGKLPSRWELDGYLVEDSLIYGGGPVKQQRDAMYALVTAGGAHTLVHPSFGSMPDIVCLKAEFSDDRAGRAIGVQFTFMKAGLRAYPASDTSTGDQSLNAASLTGIAALKDFVRTTATKIAIGAAVVQQAISTAVGWYQFAVALVNDGKRIIGSVSTLFGNFGRLFGGANSGYAGGANPQASRTTTANDLLSAASAARETVAVAGVALQEAAANPADSEALGAAVQTFVEAVAATANDPADAVRIISELAQFNPGPVLTPGPFGAAMQGMEDATSALFRRYALAQLAVTLTSYQPSSQDDADAVMTAAASLFDAEISIAGDAGDDESYQALRQTRQAVVADMAARGADLSVIANFSFQASLPSLALANRIYRDAAREPGLVQQIDPRHPAFCPTAFKALAA
ncbi:prophage DNA circulation protein [Paraburkholderia sp. BL8N3]|nr:DNA circularization N-terminal domain-containing protein [Paraburkholderia sp. BL8N3]TCK36730.1 prophage DNA circulation protein [Paraburkholderia sp. BL8N3]